MKQGQRVMVRYIPALSFDPRDHQSVGPGRLVAHPGDHGGFGSLLDRDTHCPRHGTTADWRGMVGHGSCQAVGKLIVVRVKGQERHDRPEEVFDVLGLSLLTTASVGFPLLGVALRGTLGFEFGTDAVEGRRRCPTRPVRRSFDPSSRPRCNARRQPLPGG